MTIIHWASGSACDLFLSLFVLHHAGDFGLRPTWAAGVRQRLSSESRETLEKIFSFSGVPLAWIVRMPAPQEARAAIQKIRLLTPAARLPALTLSPELPEAASQILVAVANRQSWSPEQRASLSAHFGRGPGPSPAGFDNLLNAWSRLAESGEKYLAALEEYYRAFFTEDEERIRPALEAGLASAQTQAGTLSTADLIENLSRGICLDDPDGLHDLTLVPSWWVTPLVYMAHPKRKSVVMAFGVRPETQPGAEGSEAPERLVNALKSLGDSSRLRILRYLASGPLSPSELARLLRLRPPTVIHHLRQLRFAGLVQVTVSADLERRYALRREALQSIRAELEEYLNPHV